MERLSKLWKKRPVLVSFCLLFFLSVIFFLGFLGSAGFAELFATGPAAAVRWLLGAISSPLPFSLFEVLVAAAVLYVVFLIVFALYLLVRLIRKRPIPTGWHRFYPGLLAAGMGVFILFVFTLAPCYYRHATARHMDLDTDGVDEEAVFFALERLVEVIAEAEPSLLKNENGESLAPTSLSEIKRSVTEAADAFGEKHPFYQKSGFSAKSFLSSPWMTYTHIAGVYGFFTGEANVNTNYPHFVVTSSIAHETCHARGIAPENECNFLAAVILMESDSPYLRYCGAMGVIDDFIVICKSLDAARTSEILKDCPAVRGKDLRAYSRFFEPYRHSAASKVADTANSTYLKAMGQKEGTVSYSRIIRLTAAYFQKNNP